MPTVPSAAGVEAVAAAAKRFKDEAGVDMVKIDIRTHEEELFDEVYAVQEVGLYAYPQISFPTQGAARGIQEGRRSTSTYTSGRTRSRKQAQRSSTSRT